MTVFGRRGSGTAAGLSFPDAAQACPILSCDVFDTAIRRILARPEDVPLAVGARALAQGLTALSPDAFAVARQAAEHRARAAASAAGFDEVRIAEIHAALHAAGIVTDPARTARLEFEVECAVCRPVEAMRSVVLARLARGGRVVFASDTCLPGAWLAELLESCGYGPGQHVFTSADLRLNKHTGRLFPAMLEALGCAAGDVLHVGDNPTSDLVRPRAFGIAALHLPAPRAHPETTQRGLHHLVRLHDSRHRAMAALGDAVDIGDDPDSIGRWLGERVAPLLIGFSLFILAQAETRGIGQLWFLARDGFLPMAIIRRILDRRGTPDRLGLHYLAVSRLAMQDAAAARAYLDQEGFLRPGKRLVIDVGWRGSLQRALTRAAALPPDDVVGCYLGLWADALDPELNLRNAAGYLFSFGAPSAAAAAVREAYVVLEMILSAPHGTVAGYAAGADGRHAPVLIEEQGTAGARRRAVFAAMEAACLRSVDALGDMLADAWPEAVDPVSALSPLEPVLLRPTRREAAMLNSVPFINTDGAGTIATAVNPLPLREAILFPARSLRRLENAPWRAGAVRLALPWPMPGMSFEVLQWRARRVLDRAGRLRRLFSRG